MRIVLIVSAFLFSVAAASGARIVEMSGQVELRRGVDEHWQSANLQDILRDIDSIVTGENSEVVLELPDKSTFRLKSNAMIDIADLRKVSDHDLFLFLMQQKVNKLEKRTQPTPLRIGNVSVVHGESREETAQDTETTNVLPMVRNGIRALYGEGLFPNTIIKLYRLMPTISENDCGEMFYYLGSSFEELDNPGQARDAYNQAIQQHQPDKGCQNDTYLNEAQAGIQRLREN